MARILVTWNLHPNEGGGPAARKIAGELRKLGHEVECLRLPFEGSNWHLAGHNSRRLIAKLREGSGFREAGAKRLLRAASIRQLDAVLDVHTAPKRFYSTPGVTEGNWQHLWLNGEQPIPRDSEGNFKPHVIGRILGKDFFGYGANLELPAETKAIPKRWLRPLVKAFQVDPDTISYSEVHRPVRISAATAKRIARDFIHGLPLEIQRTSSRRKRPTK